MLIEHLVLSGAGYNGIQLVAALYEAEKIGIFKVGDIKSVYGSSAGAVVLAIWLLGIEKTTLYDFIINRPWEKTFTLAPNIMWNIINKKGACTNNIISEILFPLLRSKYFDEELTLKQLYEITKIDFHIFATGINNLTIKDFSHETYPDLKLIDAIYMSSSIPFIFQPHYFENEFIADGGLSLHFPVKPCIESGCNKENILGINVTRPPPAVIDENISLASYTYLILNNIFRRLAELSNIEIPHLITIEVVSLGDFPNVITDPAIRQELWLHGEKCCNLYLQSCMQELA